MIWKTYSTSSVEEQERVSQEFAVVQKHDSTNSGTSSQAQGEKLGKPERNQILAVLAISYLCISCGNFLGYTSSAIISMKEDVDSNFTSINSHDVSWIGSLGPLGAVCGGLFAVFPIKYFGVRKTILYFGSTLFILSWVIVGNSNTLSFIFIGRFLGGVSTAIVISCAPLYVVEISSVQQRGKLGVLPQGLMLLGILTSYTLGNVLNWRWVARACGIISVPSIIFLRLAPETPSYLMSNGSKWEQILQVLELFHEPKQAQLEYELLSQKLQQNDQKSNNELKLFDESSSSSTSTSSSTMKYGHFKACAVAIAVMTFQQLTGINGVTFYAVTIFKKTEIVSVLYFLKGADNLCSVHLFPVFLILAQCIGSFTSSMIIERVGRRTLLCISTGSISLMAGILGFYFYFDGVSNQSLFWIPLISLILYVGTFALGLGSTVWIYVSETLPERIRGIMNPLIIGYTWFCVFLITKSFPLLLTEIYIHGIFWMYSCFAMIAFIFVYTCVPETKGRSTQEIEYYFIHGHYDDEGLEETRLSSSTASSTTTTTAEAENEEYFCKISPVKLKIENESEDH